MAPIRQATRKKGRHLKEEIVATSYKASIDDGDLRIFIAAGWVECSTVYELTNRQIILWVEKRWKKEATGEELYSVDQAVKPVAMQMHVFEAEDRIWSLRTAYSQAVLAAAYGAIIQTKLQIAINHFLKRLKPFQFQLYRRMVDMITWRKNQNFHKRTLIELLE